jgi:hypothetical protein
MRAGRLCGSQQRAQLHTHRQTAYIRIRTYVHVYTCIHIRTQLHTHKQTATFVCTRTDEQRRLPATGCVHTCAHPFAVTHTHTRTPDRILQCAGALVPVQARLRVPKSNLNLHAHTHGHQTAYYSALEHQCLCKHGYVYLNLTQT